MSYIKKYTSVAIGVIFATIVIVVLFQSYETVPSGFVGVGDVFGKVQQKTYEPGFNMKWPWVHISLEDGREKTKKVTIGIPTQDQQTTTFDISFQYRMLKSMAPKMKSETGTFEDAVEVHLDPTLHSVTREIGKGVAKAEDFFEKAVQATMQKDLHNALTSLSEKGILVEKVLIRDVRLPKKILDAIEARKEVSQAAQKATEELKKFKIEQQRKEEEQLAMKKADLIKASKKVEVDIKLANGRLQAAEIDAKAILITADAKAAAEKKTIAAVGEETYRQLELAKSLTKLAEGNHIIVMDPKGNMLPFMDMNKFTK